MRPFTLLLAVMIGLGMTGLATVGRAGDDIAAARAVIGAQQEAFARDDAAQAYGHAAPGIQGMFGDPDRFMAMVRHAYAPIYRHRSFEFTDSKSADGTIEQTVRIVDSDGVAWDALYTLEPQPDGSMKISGCMLLKVGQSV